MLGNSKIEKYDIISFDIFDTLIKRKVYDPNNIFKYVEFEYNKRYPEKLIGNFKEKRLLAAQRARMKSLGKEITIQQIYDELDVDDRSILLDLEKEIEIRMCEPNTPVLEIYKKSIGLEKKVIIISDMYLDRETILKMLEKCGVLKFEKLYLSSEIGAMKKDGELFRYVLNDLKVNPHKIKHFGDRFHTDFINAMKEGIKSSKCDRFVNYLTCVTNKEYERRQSDLLAFVNLQQSQNLDETEAFKLGYESFGPVLLGYTQWIRTVMKTNNLKKLFLLARDMYLVKQVYEDLFPDQNPIYLEISRRSLREAYILKENRLDAIFDTITRKKYTVGDMLSHIDITTGNCQWLEKKYSDILNEKLNGKLDIQWYQELEIDVLNELGRRDNNTILYLKQMGFYTEDNIAIVDIGWHGTIQNMLEVISGKKVKGIYFGIGKRYYFNNMDMIGYWYDVENEDDALANMTMVSILETMLFNEIGTTVAYSIDNGRAKPIYRQCERKDSVLINDFQRGALCFVKDYTNSFTSDAIINKDEAIKPFHQLVYRPTLKQAELFALLPYEEGAISFLAKKRSYLAYIRHPSWLLKDYEAAKWKTGFIKRILPIFMRPDRIDYLIKIRRARGLRN